MALPPGFLQELRARLTLSAIVGRRIRLQRKGGGEHLGLCPFHNEKTPSFTVSDSKGFFHCFGCGAHGDVIAFEMRIDNLPFRDAVERLAAEAGLTVPAESPEAEAAGRKATSLREVMGLAVAYYKKCLRLPDGREARDYLRGRGVEGDLLDRFQLGYAPAGQGLRAALQREGVAVETLIDLGLVGRPDDGRPPYDIFRNRVMFPILDSRDRPVAFGGRALGEAMPKYLNSPETALFHKGATLYNLGAARAAARGGAALVVVEGYMDVIALARVGLGQAVAPLGTALTESQLAALWATSAEPILCFDGDAAGQRAAARALERALPLLEPGRSLRFALLPAGRDPDDLIRAGGQEAIRRVLDGAVPLHDMAWRSLTAGRVVDTPERQAGLERAIEDLVARLGDASLRTHYRRVLRDRFWAGLRRDPAAAPRQGRAGADRRGSFPTGPRGRGGGRPGAADRMGRPEPPALGAPPPPIDPRRLRERLLLAAVINHPGLFDHVGERLGSLALGDATLDRLRQEVVITLSGEKALDRQGLLSHLTDAGLGANLALVTGRDLLVHGGFVRVGADPGLVRDGWDHTYELHQRDALLVDLRRASERLGAQPTEDALDHLLAVKQQDRWSEGAGPDTTPGTACGRPPSRNGKTGS